VLSAAAWLVDREFDAEVGVLAAEESPDDVGAKVEPGRPAIDIGSRDHGRAAQRRNR
jgi:leucyl-tRNA synthetase